MHEDEKAGIAKAAVLILRGLREMRRALPQTPEFARIHAAAEVAITRAELDGLFDDEDGAGETDRPVAG